MTTPTMTPTVLRMCRHGGPDVAHYWDATTGAAVADPAVSQFTPEALCPCHGGPTVTDPAPTLLRDTPAGATRFVVKKGRQFVARSNGTRGAIRLAPFPGVALAFVSEAVALRYVEGVSVAEQGAAAVIGTRVSIVSITVNR